jgi:hypothetical protein
MTEPDALLALFARYNPDVWPLPVLAYALAIVAFALIISRPSRTTDRIVVGLLVASWLWLGVVFQGIYVSDVDPNLGVVYAAMFIVEAGLLITAGVVGHRIAFRREFTLATLVGVLAIAYALVVYPILGIALGHPYPEAPLFGAAPCPTTIVTFGLFLLARPPFPKLALAIPLFWAVVAPLAAVQRGVVEDIGLLVFGVVAVVLILWRDRALTRLVRRPVAPFA